jgi:hypothetical protein
MRAEEQYAASLRPRLPQLIEPERAHVEALEALGQQKRTIERDGCKAMDVLRDLPQ